MTLVQIKNKLADAKIKYEIAYYLDRYEAQYNKNQYSLYVMFVDVDTITKKELVSLKYKALKNLEQ